VTKAQLLEDWAADLAWKCGEQLVGSPTYNAILKGLKRAYAEGHADGRVFESDLHRSSDRSKTV
jgi:hypothetical protein